ncbi:MAG: UDP-N-acetylmuramoyl-tripeptide--D-alanyl-D-alanine ligase [Candidatus Tokpelaia sp. JSC161]|jgi:UDP-N-acetylmuramoyl-tripeptide--D-alanyl-D-alanine ligase|nr:MAG: UDP-N-acetylmuramoyl-tripeptide--D-alanyl-D-alanine ligase [Candidatus Tokpelaia sp. JSC161]
MIVLWKWHDFLNAIGGDSMGRTDAICGISIDTRTLQKGDAFFAIQGKNFDGHDFVPMAVEKGASVLVLSQKYALSFEKDGECVPLILVNHVREALEKLARVARSRSSAKVIAVTGSVGKTTTKDALFCAFSRIGNVYASPYSFNNHWGVPLALARMPLNTDFGIFEIGMNHKNEIRQLVKLVAPDIAIITRIAAAHLRYFDNMEGIADAKAEIFEGLQSNGVVFLNINDSFFLYLKRKAYAVGVRHVLSFGDLDTADYRLKNIEIGDDSLLFKARLPLKEVIVKVNVPGVHMAHNCLAVLGVADILAVDMARVLLGLQNFFAGKGRGMRYKVALPGGGSFLLIDETYNANPASMRAALSVLRKNKIGSYGRRVAVLGDMLELGHVSRREHEELALPIRASGISRALLVGPYMKYLSDILRDYLHVSYCERAINLLNLLLNDLHAGDIIMLKASKNIGLSRIVDAVLEKYHIVC